MSRRILWSALIVGTPLSLAAALAVATEWLILGSFEGRWFYGYGQPFSIWPVVVTVLVTIALAALVQVRIPSSGRGEWAVVGMWLVAGIALQATVRTLTPVTMENIFRSDAANSFYTVTQQHDAGDVLARFNRIRLKSPLHAQSNMPGKVMFVYSLELISRRPAILPWLVVIVSNAGAVLIYIFTRELFGDRQTALFAAILYLFLPAKLVFFPLMNTVTPVVVLTCACLLLWWLRTGRAGYAVLLGVALYGLVFFEPLPLVIGLLFLALAWRAIALGHIAWDHFILHGALAALTLILTSEVVRIVFDFDLIRAFRQVRGHAIEFNAVEGRPYWIWVRANLGEFAYGVGVCQAAIFFGAWLYALHLQGHWRDRLTHPLLTMCTSLLAVLVATDLIGANRGEVIRLWIFLGCLFQIPVAYVCAALKSKTAVLAVLFCSVLQAALGTSMIRFVVP